MNEPNLLGKNPAETPTENPVPAENQPALAAPESVPAQETGADVERQPETSVAVASETPAGQVAESRVAPSGAAPAPAAPAQQDTLIPKVERVLEDGLWDVYVSLPEKARFVFKKKGEETAQAIRLLITKSHVRAGKIHDLVHDWLAKIPGVNEWFLLQESKIKTDTFLKLAVWIMRKAGLA